MAFFEISGLTVSRQGHRILDGLALSLAAGEVHALIGTNGTGKSTLAYAIMGCRDARPDTGDIRMDGKSLIGMDVTARARLGIALAWQEPVRFEGLSVSRYLALGQTRRAPSDALAMVGLEPKNFLTRMVDRNLSGGERKRIELASLLTMPLRLAVLDEPDSGIDMLSTGGILDVIQSFRTDGATVLLITHQEQIVRMAERASQICNGKIVNTGAPDRVADQYLGRHCPSCLQERCRHDVS